MIPVILRSAACVLLLGAAIPLAAGAAPPAAPAAKRLITLDDLARFRDVTDPRVSPEGGWVAYTVRTQNLEADKRQTDLWMTSWDGVTTLRLTTTATQSESSPRWSPDGRSLAFLSGRGDDDEAAQLWLLPRAGGEAEKVSAVKAGISDYAWSPDGARFVFVVSDSDSVATGKDKAPPPIVTDRFYFKEDGTGYLTHKRSHLYLFDLATRKMQQLTKGDFDDVGPVWSPDGKSVAFLSKRGPDADRTSSWEIFVVEARAGATPRQLTRYEGAVNNYDAWSSIAWSPAGGEIAFLQSGPEKLLYYAVPKLAVVPAAGGPVRVLTGELDRGVQDFAWTPDGRALYFVLEDDRARHLLRVPAGGGAPERLIEGRLALAALNVGPSGRIAALVSTSQTLPEVFAIEGSGLRALSRQNDSLLAALRLAPAEETRFESRDGTMVHGFLVTPPGHRAGTRHPLILQIHGGPTSQFECELDPEWQLYAARGYVVVAANPRGSTGRGEAYCRAILADWGNKDAQDVIPAVDDAIARGVADPKRLGVGGWSYGGMLTNYVISRDARFKAATSGASIANMLAGYGTDMYVREWEAELGTPWTATAKYLELSSPFLHADRIVTPTLFLCGEKDFNVPLLNTEQMYQALRSLGRETQLVIYPGQSHGLARPSYIADRQRRYLDWFGRHLK